MKSHDLVLQKREDREPDFPSKESIQTFCKSGKNTGFFQGYYLVQIKDNYYLYQSNQDAQPVRYHYKENGLIDCKLSQSGESIFSNDYLGEGCNSIVVKCYKVNPKSGEVLSDKPWALKRIFVVDDIDFQKIQQEAKCLQKCGRVGDLTKLGDNVALLITNYFAGSQLGEFKYNKEDSRIELNPILDTLTFSQAIQLICKLTAAIKSIHDLDLVHLDLSLSNVKLVENKETKEIDVAIIDFGSMQPVKKNDLIKLGEYQGSPFQRADELMQGQGGKKSDIPPFLLMIILILKGKDPLLHKRSTCHQAKNMSVNVKNKVLRITNFLEATSHGFDCMMGYNLEQVGDEFKDIPHPKIKEYILHISKKMQSEYEERIDINDAFSFFNMINTLCQEFHAHVQSLPKQSFNFENYFTKLNSLTRRKSLTIHAGAGHPMLWQPKPKPTEAEGEDPFCGKAWSPVDDESLASSSKSPGLTPGQK